MKLEEIIVVALLVVFSTALAVAEEVKIGLITPLTGIRADAGEYSRNGALLAAKEINVLTDNQYQLRLIVEDSHYNGRDSLSSFQKLKNVDGVNYIIGPHSSSCVLAVAPIAEKTRTILIATGAQSDEISDAGDYIFRVIHNARYEAPFFAKFVASQMTGSTIHFLALQTAFADSYLKHFTPAFEKAGKRVGKVEIYDTNTTDFRPPLLRLKKERPEAIFLVATPLHSGHILRQANDIGLSAQFYNIAVEGPELISIGGKLAEGMIYPYSYDSESKRASVRNFVAKYQEQYSAEPDTVAANTYDSIKLLHSCFVRVGVSTEAVKDCLYKVKAYDGASGVFDIDENGDAIKALIVKTVKDGKFRKLVGP